MAKVQLPTSTKHAQISKAQSTMLITIVIASIVTIFCLMSAKALLSQAAYQRKVVNANHAAVKQLQKNVIAAKQLVTQYNGVFEGGSTTNIIGGKNDTSPGAQPPNGDNSRIVLDALPSQYDFPALVSSLSKILNSDAITNQAITGTDESATVNGDAKANPVPVQIQLTVSGTGTAAAVQTFVKDLERSIRPFDVTSLQLSGPQAQLIFSMNVNTYYQPARSLSITSQVVH